MNDPAPSPSCPDCGEALPAHSPHALCPACLMRQALASRTMTDEGGKTDILPPPSPGEIADKFPGYEILECLGRGGMGVVYKARQKSLDRWVAIKLLAPERVHDERFAEHFEREAKTLARMSHPNIVTVFDHGQTDGLFFIVMEYVDGVNLRDLLREGKMEPAQALAIIPPICEALEYAHDKGIVHRDIKPENILLDREGRVKIADFGIASLVGATGEKSGTPPYMAPEQESGTVDRRADIYALGAVLYEMLTGERPNKEIVAPSKKVQIDVRLDEIVLRALEKSPELRYQTAGVFKTRVETMVSAMGASTHPVASPGVPPNESVEAISGGKPPAEANTTATLTQRWTIYRRRPGMILKAIGLGVLVSIVAHVMAFGAAEGIGNELLNLPRVANHFIYPAVEGLFASFAILGILINHRRLPIAAMAGIALACLSAFCVALPALGVRFDTEIPLMVAIVANFVLFPVYFLQLFLKRASGGPTAVTPIVSPVNRHPWPIWLTFGIHALMLVGLTGFLVSTVPRFTAMVTDLGVELPVVTQLIIGFSNFTVRGGYLLVPVLIAVDFALCWLANKLGGRKLLAGWAVLGVVVLLGLGVFAVGSTFLPTSRMVAAVAEGDPGTTSTPAEFQWREVAALSPVKEKWESGVSAASLQSVLKIDQPPITAPRYALIGEIKYENVEGTAYLEMWSHFSNGVKYFTRTLAPPGSGPMAAITGSSDWRPFTLPFDRSGTTDPLSKLEVNLHLPAKGKVYVRGLRLVEDSAAPAPEPIRPAPLKPIPEGAAGVFEQLRNMLESRPYKDLLKKHPIDEIDRVTLEMYEYEVNNQLEILKELLRDTAAEQAMTESLALSEQMKQASAVGGIDPELIKRAEVVSLELEQLLNAAAQDRASSDSPGENGPPLTAPDNPGPKNITITLAADGALTLEGQPCPLDQLADRLKKLAGQEPVLIRLQADKRTPYQQVAPVLDACNASGIKDITFSVEIL